jgi:hypothetical protein
MCDGDGMIFKLRIFSWRFTFTLAPVTDIIGVNSRLSDGDHIIMWDFDDVELCLVAATLKWVQKHFELPNIYIMNTGTQDHYIAYCFERCCWHKSVAVVAETNFVDPNFFKYGVYRERWTLRVSPKESRKMLLVKTLYSPISESASIAELNSWVKGIKHAELRLNLSFSQRGLSFQPEAILNHITLSLPAYNMRHSLMLRQ